MQRLKRENRRLEEENQILRKAAAFSPRGSHEQVCIRIGGTGEPCRGDAVPCHRR
jgi:hypothetical protein